MNPLTMMAIRCLELSSFLAPQWKRETTLSSYRSIF